MKAVLINTFHLFALLGIIFIPSASYVLPIQDDLAIWVFGDLVNLLIGDHLDFTSDTRGLNMLLILLFILAALLSLVFAKIKFWKEREAKILIFIQVLVIYYLASKMLVYGFDKVFKTQFYQPEPNTLFTAFGNLNKDILFWSTMGTSKWYCILSGIAEIVPAVLLLFRKTRIVGLLMLSLVLLHVISINIGFDISVKLYSFFLMFLTLLLLIPQLNPLIQFFVKHENARLREIPTIFRTKLHIKKGLKFFVVGMIFIEALKFPISTGYLNDDKVPRPFLHGAYEVYSTTTTGSYQVVGNGILERFFIHRRNYIIFQYKDGEMRDFPLEIDTSRQMFIIKNDNDVLNKYPYKLYEHGKRLDLGKLEMFGDTTWYKSNRLEILSLPALQDEFHWTIDEFKIEE